MALLSGQRRQISTQSYAKYSSIALVLFLISRPLIFTLPSAKSQMLLQWVKAGGCARVKLVTDVVTNIFFGGVRICSILFNTIFCLNPSSQNRHLLRPSFRRCFAVALKGCLDLMLVTLQEHRWPAQGKSRRHVNVRSLSLRPNDGSSRRLRTSWMEHPLKRCRHRQCRPSKLHICSLEILKVYDFLIIPTVYAQGRPWVMGNNCIMLCVVGFAGQEAAKMG